MDCKTTSELIMKFLEKELNSEQEKLLYEHLESCEDCRLEFDALKSTFLLLEDVELEDAPEGLENAVIARIKTEDKAKTRVQWWTMWTVWVLVILAGWGGLTWLVLYTPIVSIAVSVFNDTMFILRDVVEFMDKVLYTILSSAVKLLTLGRALGLVARVVAEMFNVAIATLLLSVGMVFILRGYMSKIIRR